MTGDGEVESRKAAILAILSEGLPSMPSHLFHLSALLTANPVDLKKVASVIRADRKLKARLLWLSNSALFRLRKQVEGVEEAAILMGTQRLRSLVFTCYLMQLTGDRLRNSDMQDFWFHSLATAMLSERIARAVGYEDIERAYHAGLMHDAGKLPLLLVLAGEEAAAEIWLKSDEEQSLAREREHFGFDHCQAGRWLGFHWNFDPGLIEVLEYHHQPEKARCERVLVSIVAAADHFCHRVEAGRPSTADEFFSAALHWMSEREVGDLLSLLDREYPLLRQQIEFLPDRPGSRSREDEERGNHRE
jgi:HD-like signal output (HDOD) protein